MANQTNGWHLLPLHTMVDGVCSCGKDCDSPGKHPRVWRGFKDASDKPSDIEYWKNKWPGTNFGVRTGEESGIVVIDVDLQKDVTEGSLEALRDASHELPQDTVIVLTGGGGLHFYYKYPGVRVPCSIGKRLGPGIDVRGDGGYVVMAGSNHVSDGKYEYLAGRSPDEIEIADMPDWMVECLTTS